MNNREQTVRDLALQARVKALEVKAGISAPDSFSIPAPFVPKAKKLSVADQVQAALTAALPGAVAAAVAAAKPASPAA